MPEPVDNRHRKSPAWKNEAMDKRFLTLADVQEILNISAPQAYSLVRGGELPAIQIGGRSQWRVEAVELEAYIQRQYEATRRRVDAEREAEREPDPVE